LICDGAANSLVIAPAPSETIRQLGCAGGILPLSGIPREQLLILASRAVLAMLSAMAFTSDELLPISMESLEGIC
jgi:hypothetical protein